VASLIAPWGQIKCFELERSLSGAQNIESVCISNEMLLRDYKMLSNGGEISLLGEQNNIFNRTLSIIACKVGYT